MGKIPVDPGSIRRINLKQGTIAWICSREFTWSNESAGKKLEGSAGVIYRDVLLCMQEVQAFCAAFRCEVPVIS